MDIRVQFKLPKGSKSYGLGSPVRAYRNYIASRRLELRKASIKMDWWADAFRIKWPHNRKASEVHKMCVTMSYRTLKSMYDRLPEE